MKSQNLFPQVLLAATICAINAWAQDRISVPLKDPARPATLVVRLLRGKVTVRGYSGKEIVIESSGKSPGDKPENKRGRHDDDDVPPGMHRVSAGFGPLNAVEENNVVTVRAGASGDQDMTIEVPENTAVKIRETNGQVFVEGVSGEIDVDSSNGDITVNGASAAVLAHSTNGKIAASFRQLPANKPVNLSTMNGNIELTLPADSKANLIMKTENGDIVTDFDLKTEPSSSSAPGHDNRNRGDKHHASRGRAITGTLNGGGGEINLASYNGRLTIGKTK